MYGKWKVYIVTITPHWNVFFTTISMDHKYSNIFRRVKLYPVWMKQKEEEQYIHWLLFPSKPYITVKTSISEGYVFLIIVKHYKTSQFYYYSTQHQVGIIHTTKLNHRMNKQQTTYCSLCKADISWKIIKTLYKNPAVYRNLKDNIILK